MTDKERITNAVDEIEIPHGARERMLSNIMKKASEQKNGQTHSAPAECKPERKSFTFQRVLKWSLPIAACFVLAFVGVRMMTHPNQQNEPVVGAPGEFAANPFLEVASPDEILNEIGIAISVPENADNITCYIIDGEIGEVSFSLEDHMYCIRASKQSGDFSGLNGTVAHEEKIDAANDASLVVIDAGDEIPFRKITWTGEKAAYYVLINTDGASSETLKSLYSEIK